METMNYKGTVYIVHEFTNDNPHIEPCWECCFGTKCSVGIYPHVVKGKTVMVQECGWKCHKPDDFDPCTAVMRSDHRNVFFQVHRKEARQ